MQTKPLLSVDVPVFNAEKYLVSCIESILTQTFTDFELILVDDGSTDSSSVICDEYAKKDSRIRVVHQPNGGAGVARNTGLVSAVGEWFTFVDADDMIEKEMFADFYSAAIFSGAGLIVGGMKVLVNEQIHSSYMISKKQRF